MLGASSEEVIVSQGKATTGCVAMVKSAKE